MKFDKVMNYITSIWYKPAFCWKVAGIGSSPLVTPAKGWSIQEMMIDNNPFFVHLKGIYNILGDL